MTKINYGNIIFDKMARNLSFFFKITFIDLKPFQAKYHIDCCNYFRELKIYLLDG